jgi:putative membrane protein
MSGQNSAFLPITFLSSVIVIVYFRGWHKLRADPSGSIPLWRSLCFPCGLVLVWMVTCSSLATLDHMLLAAHMAQHLLLMSLAPFLILWSRPKVPLLHGLPVAFVRSVVDPLSRTRFVRYIAALWGRPVFCWVCSIGVLVFWHIPVLFNAALQIESWHVIEHVSFLVGGFLFWSPLFAAEGVRESSTWPLVLYFFLATLPCDILSGFLVFSDRVVYSIYLTHREFSAWSALDDQQCAGALMWTCVTILYLVPAAVLTIRLLGAKRSNPDEVLGNGADVSASVARRSGVQTAG